MAPEPVVLASATAILPVESVVQIRRSDHRDGTFRFTLRNRPWPGTTSAQQPIWSAPEPLAMASSVVPELEILRAHKRRGHARRAQAPSPLRRECQPAEPARRADGRLLLASGLLVRRLIRLACGPRPRRESRIPIPGSDRDPQAVPIRLDPWPTPAPQPDLEDLRRSARLTAEEHIDPFRVNRAEARQAQWSLGRGVHVRRRCLAAHPRPRRPHP